TNSAVRILAVLPVGRAVISPAVPRTPNPCTATAAAPVPGQGSTGAAPGSAAVGASSGWAASEGTGRAYWLGATARCGAVWTVVAPGNPRVEIARTTAPGFGRSATVHGGPPPRTRRPHE